MTAPEAKALAVGERAYTFGCSECKRVVRVVARTSSLARYRAEQDHSWRFTVMTGRECILCPRCPKGWQNQEEAGEDDA